MSYFLAKFFAISIFAVLLGAFSLCHTHKAIKKERDDAMAHSAKAASEYRHLSNKIKETENELHAANEKLRDANNDMDEERKDFRDAIQDLKDQHRVDQEEIRSLKQHVSNTECDRDEHLRWLGYASRAKKLAQATQDLAREKQNLVKENQKLEDEKQKLKDENQQLEASLTAKDTTIKSLQAQANNTATEAVAPAPSSPIYISLNDQAEIYQQVQQPWAATPSLSDTSTKQAATDGRASERDEPIPGRSSCHNFYCTGATTSSLHLDLEQQNQALTSQIEGLRTDLETLRNEHGKCSRHLQTQLAMKDGDMNIIRAEKETADEDSANSAKIIAALQAELGEKEQKVEEASRQAQAQFDRDSASQKSKIGELTASNGRLEDTLRVKNDEIVTLQRCVRDSHKDLEELQKKHATCNEHASSQALQLTHLHGVNGSLRASNDDLTQKLHKANIDRADLIREGQRVVLEQQNQARLNLGMFSQSETRSLQARIQTLTQRVDKQQEHIHALKTNCPRCQNLRAALDAVEADVKMSDDESRAEMKREVREELRSQVPDDLRRQLRVEIERSLRAEFQKRYSDLHASNSKRIQEQDRLIKDQNAELERAKNIPGSCVNHAACEKREGSLLASITKLESNAKILLGNCSRLKSNTQNDREQLNSAQTANEDLRREIEKIKADQRRAQNVNPLQSKLQACQREVEKTKEDRDKARNNCSIYSKNYSDLKKRYEALEKEHSTFKGRGPLDGDSLTEDGCREGLIAVQKEETIRTLQSEVAKLSKELEDRKARGCGKDQGMEAPGAVPAIQTLPVDEGEQQWPEGSFPDDRSSRVTRDEATALDALRHEVDLQEARDGKKAVYAVPATSACPAPKSTAEIPRTVDLQPARQPTNESALAGGKKRERAEYWDGEVDNEEVDDRKKVKMNHGRPF